MAVIGYVIWLALAPLLWRLFDFVQPHIREWLEFVLEKVWLLVREQDEEEGHELPQEEALQNPMELAVVQWQEVANAGWGHRLVVNEVEDGVTHALARERHIVVDGDEVDRNARAHHDDVGQAAEDNEEGRVLLVYESNHVENHAPLAQDVKSNVQTSVHALSNPGKEVTVDGEELEVDRNSSSPHNQAMNVEEAIVNHETHPVDNGDQLALLAGAKNDDESLVRRDSHPATCLGEIGDTSGPAREHLSSNLVQDTTLDKLPIDDQTEVGGASSVASLAGKRDDDHIEGICEESLEFVGNEAFILASDSQEDSLDSSNLFSGGSDANDFNKTRLSAWTEQRVNENISQDVSPDVPSSCTFPLSPRLTNSHAIPSTPKIDLAARRQEYKAHHGHFSPNPNSRKGKGRAAGIASQETEIGHYDETQDITARDENNNFIGRDVEAVACDNDEFEDGNRAFIVASDSQEDVVDNSTRFIPKTPRKAVGAISQDVIISKPGQEMAITTSFPYSPVSFHVSVSPPPSTPGSKLAAQRREYKARHGHVSPDAASRKGKGRAVTAEELFESSHTDQASEVTNTIENDPVAAHLPAIFTDSVPIHPQNLFCHTAHSVAPGRLSFADIRQMAAASNHERGASQQVPSDTVTDSSIKADRRGRSQTAEVIMDARILVDLNGPCHQRAISDGTRCTLFPSRIPRPSRGPISFPRRERSRADSGPASAAVNLVETRPFMPELAGDENEQPDPVNSQDIAPSEGPNLMHSNLSAFRSQMRLSELGPIAHISSSQIWATETPTTPPGSPLKSVDMPCKDSSTNASEQVNPLAQPILAVVAAESTEMTRSERIRHLPTHLRQQLGRDIESGDLTFLEECGPAVPVALVHSTALVPVAQIEAVKTGCTALNTTPSSGSLWSTTSRSYMSLSELGVGPSSTLTEALGKLPNADKLLGDFSPTKSRPVRIAPVGFSGEEEGSGLTRSERVDRLPAHYQGQHGNNVQSGDIVFLEDMHDGAGPRALAHSTGVSCAKVGGERAEDVMDSDMVEVVVKQAADNRQATFI
ncbi:hypothetical protein MIND_00663900 [Mycena indigotica]|uniref:Uncharacterized protein n=1 Tax=Mycena indigotica TaxID=2126181 RepID=A0A8H6SLH5_9AGAR|nr:uncharacterized protein MIND_00663900 [Mycena indigotica]KAF7301005.1 hypothetical protein MIND_00663900 [Mycena indigotica]